MNKIYIGLGLAFIGGTALGLGGGYFAAIKKLDAQYNEKMEAEIERTKEFYKRVYDKDDLETTAAKAGVDVTLDEAAEAMRSYQGKTTVVDTGTLFAEVPVSDVPEEPVEKNIFDNGDELFVDKENRDTSKPYIIDIGEYMDTPDNFEQLSLTYYASDGILGDDSDEPVPDFNVDNVVGRMNLMQFGASDPDQPHVLLVRNEKMKTDFEITHSDGSFAHEVAGLSHSDETFQSIRRRPRREE